MLKLGIYYCANLLKVIFNTPSKNRVLRFIRIFLSQNSGINHNTSEGASQACHFYSIPQYQLLSSSCRKFNETEGLLFGIICVSFYYLLIIYMLTISKMKFILFHTPLRKSQFHFFSLFFASFKFIV